MRESKLVGVVFMLVLMLAWELAAQWQLLNPLIVPPLSRGAIGHVNSLPSAS